MLGGKMLTSLLQNLATICLGNTVFALLSFLLFLAFFAVVSKNVNNSIVLLFLCFLVLAYVVAVFSQPMLGIFLMFVYIFLCAILLLINVVTPKVQDSHQIHDTNDIHHDNNEALPSKKFFIVAIFSTLLAIFFHKNDHSSIMATKQAGAVTNLSIFEICFIMTPVFLIVLSGITFLIASERNDDE